MTATHPYIPRISVIFDFDETLASDTIDAICAAWDMSRKEWEERYNEPLGKGWDGILRRGQALIACGQDKEQPLADDLFAAAAQEISLYPGVAELPSRLRETAQAIHEPVEVELLVLSSGYAEMIKATPVADLFDRIWAGAFHFSDGEAVTVKRIISHGEKARYIEAYAKDLDLDAANEPETDKPGFDEADMHVPFDQIIYVGDGLSDLKAFEFVTNHGGLAIAIDRSAQFDHEDEQTETQRVDNLASPDYSEGSELLLSLKNAVRSAAARVALRSASEGE